MPAILPALRSGLVDDQEIQLISLLSLHKAIDIHPQSAIAPSLPSFIGLFAQIVDARARDTAVKQELERMDEGRLGVIKLALHINHRYTEGLPQQYTEWWKSVREHQAPLLKSIDAESKQES